MAAAILVAASVAILAGIAVLIGAIAASRQARSYDSVIMKMLGATRRQILAAQALEYGCSRWSSRRRRWRWASRRRVVRHRPDVRVRLGPDWAVILATLGRRRRADPGIALLGSLPLLRLRPAAALRSL